MPPPSSSDLATRPGLSGRVVVRVLPDTRVETIPRHDVRRLGHVRCRPRRPWVHHIRIPRTRRAHGSQVDPVGRVPLHFGCRYLRCKCFLSFDNQEIIFSSHLTIFFFYVQARWPERSASQKFDIWGSSHQIFHVLILFAAASHLYGTTRAFDFHHRALGARC